MCLKFFVSYMVVVKMTLDVNVKVEETNAELVEAPRCNPFHVVSL